MLYIFPPDQNKVDKAYKVAPVPARDPPVEQTFVCGGLIVCNETLNVLYINECFLISVVDLFCW